MRIAIAKRTKLLRYRKVRYAVAARTLRTEALIPGAGFNRANLLPALRVPSQSRTHLLADEYRIPATIPL